MAVTLLRVIQRWIGLASDTKPTTAPVGSTFYEYDTGLTWITHDGGTTWVPYKYELSTINVSVNRDLPSLTDFWETEALVAAIWETTIDGAGTEAFATAGGYMYYDMDTAAAAADTDVFLNSKYRWVFIPSVFADDNTIIRSLTLEWEAQIVTAVTDHDNTHFFMGFTSAKSNDITQANLAGFYLLADELRGKTDKGNSEETTGDIAATLTNWNKFKITVESASVTFSFNGVDEPALVDPNDQPDVAMYLVFGTRAEGANAVGLNVGPIRAYYEEIL